jgi:fibronectin type 3 domain-containing protein
MNTSQTLVLTASGTAATTITSITSSNSIFTHSSVVLPLTLQPGEQASISVTAAPKTVGTESGQLTIQSNATTDASLAVPVSVDGTSASAHYVDLAWQAPTSTPTPIAGYKVYRATSASGPFTLLNTTLDTGTTYVDNSVTAGSLYYYHVTSSTSGSVESDPSNMVTVTVPTP